MKIILSVLILLFSTSIAFSEEPADLQNNNCNNPQSQAEMNGCAYILKGSVQRNLDEAYNRSLESMQKYDNIIKNDVMSEEIQPDSAEELLKKSQDFWIKYRDAVCRSEGILFNGGAIQPNIIYNCIESITIERTKYLKENFLIY